MKDAQPSAIAATPSFASEAISARRHAGRGNRAGSNQIKGLGLGARRRHAAQCAAGWTGCQEGETATAVQLLSEPPNLSRRSALTKAAPSRRSGHTKADLSRMSGGVRSGT